jgi:selenocysteine lyase/cysteine desulfurase
VLDRIRQAYAEDYANVHRGLHFLSNASTDAYEAARETVRRFLNAASTDEIVFTRSKGGTEAINLVASSWGGVHVGEGDEIVLTDHGAPLQHRAVALPARAPGRRAEVGGARRRQPSTSTPSSRL